MISIKTLAGIPSLLKKGPKAAAISLLGSAVSKITDAIFGGGTQWAVYQAGTTTVALDATSYVSLNIQCEASVSDYPIQTGSFVSYNKVRAPDSFVIRITNDGSKAKRAALIKWLGDNTSAPTLFDILCPEGTLSSVTLDRFQIDRTRESGVSMLTVDCYFRKVRPLPVVATSSKVAAPANKPTLPAVSVNPIVSSVVKAFPLPPLVSTGINIAKKFM